MYRGTLSRVRRYQNALENPFSDFSGLLSRFSGPVDEPNLHRHGVLGTTDHDTHLKRVHTS
jgi:hypothetical protein